MIFNFVIELEDDPPFMISSQWLYQWCDYVNVSIETFTKPAKAASNHSDSVEEHAFADLDEINQNLLQNGIYSYEGTKMEVVEEDAIYDRPG
jgi:hypothetical protein